MANAECPAALEVDDRMGRFVAGPVALEESRAIVDRPRDPCGVAESYVHAAGEGVPLVVVEEKEGIRGRFERCQPAAHGAPALHELVRVRQVRLGSPASG